MANKAYIGAKLLPNGYTRLEYIQSSGTQYINTGVKPNNNTRVVCDFQMLKTGVGQSVFGAFTFDSNYSVVDAYLLQLPVENAFVSWYGAGDAVSFNSSISASSRHLCDKNKNSCKIDTSTVSNATHSFTSSYPIYIFCGNLMDSVFEPASVRVWSVKIYDNDTLIRNYIPCINPSGEIGLYDSVNSVFYKNAGSGVFVAGSSLSASSACEVKKGYVGVNGVCRKLKKGFVGVNGVARKCFGGVDYAEMFQKMTVGATTGRSNSSGSWVYTSRESANPYFLCAWYGHMGLIHTSSDSNDGRTPLFTMSDDYGWVHRSKNSNVSSSYYWYLGNKNGYNTMSGGTIVKCNFSDADAIRQFFTDYYLVRQAYTNGSYSQVGVNVSDAKEGDVIIALYADKYAISMYQNGTWTALKGKPANTKYPCLFQLSGTTAYLVDANTYMYGGNMFLFRRK